MQSETEREGLGKKEAVRDRQRDVAVPCGAPIATWRLGGGGYSGGGDGDGGSSSSGDSDARGRIAGVGPCDDDV